MPDREDVENLLRESGCKLLRDGNHLIYRLPDGQNFVMSKTPSDFRSEKNNLAILRRRLNWRKPEPVVKVHGELKPRQVIDVAVEPQTQSAFEATLTSQIAAEKARYDFLLEEAAKVERRIALLEVVSSFSGDEAEEALRDVLGDQSQIYTPPVPKQLHSGPITDRAHVTGSHVLAATQLFDAPFSLNELLEKMLGEGFGRMDPGEHRRIRSSVISMIERLEARGEIRKDVAGIGKRPAVYSKVVIKKEGAL